MYCLRDYQLDTIEKINEAFKNSKSVLLQMPTGTGKTIIISEVVRSFLISQASGSNILILAHRRILIEQIQKTIQLVFPKYTKQQRMHPPKVRCITVQSQVKKLNDPFLNSIGLIVVDEAHHAPAESYQRIIQSCKKTQTLILGVTATPKRLDGKILTDTFDTIIISPGIQWFIKNGHLSPLKHFATSNITRKDLKNLSTKDGDYDPLSIESLFIKAQNGKLIADLVDSYLTHGGMKKCIVYAATQLHAKEICKKFNEKGISAEYIIGDMPEPQRHQLIEKFRETKYKVLVNVEIFTEGFDAPDVEVVQLARPTRSLVKYLQMVGRVTRTHPGKSHGVILDNVRLWQEHGKVTFDRDWETIWKNKNAGTANQNEYYKIDKPNPQKASQLPDLIEVEELELVKVDDSDGGFEPISSDPLVDIRVSSVIRNKNNNLNSKKSFIDFFENYLPDWNQRIGYQGKDLFSKKITRLMYYYIINYA